MSEVTYIARFPDNTVFRGRIVDHKVVERGTKPVIEFEVELLAKLKSKNSPKAGEIPIPEDKRETVTMSLWMDPTDKRTAANYRDLETLGVKGPDFTVLGTNYTGEGEPISLANKEVFIRVYNSTTGKPQYREKWQLADVGRNNSADVKTLYAASKEAYAEAYQQATNPEAATTAAGNVPF